MAEEIIQRNTAALRRSYNPQPGPGLNGGRTQNLTQPQQLDRMLTGMGQVIERASNELQWRGQSVPDTIIGTNETGAAQRARLHQMVNYRECTTEACETRRSMAEASPAQRQRLRQLNKIPVRTTRRRQPATARQNNNGNGRVSPSGMRGRQSRIGSGRPRGS